MAQSAWVRQSRSYEPSLPENRGLAGAMKCPRCHSDDVKRSRRTLAERVILPIMRAQVYRCRDCKHRFWLGVQWRFVILGCLAAAMAVGFALAVRFAYETREEQTPNTAPSYRVAPQLIPQGLPPVSTTPRSKDNPASAARATH